MKTHEKTLQVRVPMELYEALVSRAAATCPPDRRGQISPQLRKYVEDGLRRDGILVNGGGQKKCKKNHLTGV